MNERAILAVIVCLPLVAGLFCDGRGDERQGRLETGAETLVVSGYVNHAERLLIPSGGTLRVVATEPGEPGDEARIVAEATTAITGPPPYVFALPIDAEAIEEPRDVMLRAEIDVDGVRTFESDDTTFAFEGAHPRDDVQILVRFVSPSD
jgi:uncharacterized lipoprotein YbaY